MDIRGVGIVNTGFSIAVSGKPDVKAKLLLTIVTGLDVLIQVGAEIVNQLASQGA